jgi:uncharacterized protein YuzE
VGFANSTTLQYLRFQERTPEVETIRISDSVNIDLAPDGTLYGIELPNANEQLQGGDAWKLVVISEARGDRQEVPLGW